MIDLRTLPTSDQHHPLAFNDLGRTGRSKSDFLWICPTCDDGQTHLPTHWNGGEGYVHIARSADENGGEAELHKLVAVDVIAVIEKWRQFGWLLESDCNPPVERLLELGAAR